MYIPRYLSVFTRQQYRFINIHTHAHTHLELFPSCSGEHTKAFFNVLYEGSLEHGARWPRVCTLSMPLILPVIPFVKPGSRQGKKGHYGFGRTRKIAIGLCRPAIWKRNSRVCHGYHLSALTSPLLQQCRPFPCRRSLTKSPS